MWREVWRGQGYAGKEDVVQVADSPQAFAAAPAVSTQSTEDFGVCSSNISLRRKSKEALFYNLQIRHNELCKI